MADTTASAEDVARRFLAAWNPPDLDELIGFFADDAIYQDPRTVRRGRDEIRTELKAHIRAVGTTRPEIVSISSAGGTALVERSEAFQFNGAEVVVEGVVAFDVNEAGQITRMRDYFDQVAVERQIKGDG